MLTFLFIAAASQPALPRLAVLPVQATQAKVPLELIDDAVLSAAQATGRYQAIGKDDINAMLHFERQLEVLGCSEAACGSSVGQAIGAERLLVVRIGRVEQAWVASAKLIDVQNVRVEARRTEIIPGGDRALLEALPQLISNVLGAQPASVPSVASAPRARHELCGTGDECAKTGARYREEKQPALAVSFFQTGCNKGDAHACAELGRARLEGYGGPADAAEGRSLLLEACAGGDGRGCKMAAEAVRLDPEYSRYLQRQASQYLDDECVHNGEACLALADMQPDRASALPYLRKGCTIGNRAACSKLAADADVPIDENLPCADPGLCYEQGTVALHLGSRRALQTADLTFARACAAGHVAACYELGRLRASGAGGIHDAQKARTLFDFACQRNWAQACSELGAMYDSGSGGALDPTEAYEAYARALGLFGQACEGRGDRWQCCNAAWFYEYGKGVKPQPARAKGLYAKCCAAGSQLGCGRK